MEAENPWQTLSSRLIYENPWIALREDKVIDPSGKPGIYGVIHYKNLALGVIPIDAEGFTYLVGQYRYPLGQYSWEIPEGGGRLDRDPLTEIQRELLEETGLTARCWQLLLRMHLSNSVSDELALIYLAWDLSVGIARPESTEKLQVLRLPLMEAIEWVHRGKITDSLSVAGLLYVESLLARKALTLPPTCSGIERLF
ncbi:MAG: NUDIX hydrolase [Bacteroidia bacterium]|nr:NUDIX hydrolase [Bacteroidia bacterium]MCX7764933.1 NUDIX hydrolase [Bacteroidia bacterium]MDW8057947.1 NUDIX hydrolase [Bacteroidia bacterium]